MKKGGKGVKFCCIREDKGNNEGKEKEGVREIVI